jgi:hypothetical protein
MARQVKPSAGVIGLGIIGSRVVAVLRQKGYQVWLHNRSPRPEPNFLSSPAEVAESVKHIQIFVSDGEALISVERDSPHGRTVDDLFRAAGLAYRVLTRVRFAETAVALANEGLGIALVDEFTAMSPPTGLRALPIRHAPKFGVYLHWNREKPRSRQVSGLEAAIRIALAGRSDSATTKASAQLDEVRRLIAANAINLALNR